MPVPRLVNGVLFDLDGVLIDSARAWHQTITSGSNSPAAVDFATFLSTFGQGPEADQRDYFPAWTHDQVRQFYLEAFPRHLSDVALVNGARELLSVLRQRQIQTAVVTNTPRPLAEAVLRNKELDKLVDVLAAAGDAAEKPAPDLILLALDRLGLPRDRVFYVGDSPSDLAAARSAGVFMFGLDADGDRTISQLSELTEWLN